MSSNKFISFIVDNHDLLLFVTTLYILYKLYNGQQLVYSTIYLLNKL